MHYYCLTSSNSLYSRIIDYISELQKFNQLVEKFNKKNNIRSGNYKLYELQPIFQVLHELKEREEGNVSYTSFTEHLQECLLYVKYQSESYTKFQIEVTRFLDLARLVDDQAWCIEFNSDIEFFIYYDCVYLKVLSDEGQCRIQPWEITKQDYDLHKEVKLVELKRA